jgi:two-component system response regulator HydG
VRELQNLAQRLVIFADAGVIDTVDLPTVMRYLPTVMRYVAPPSPPSPATHAPCGPSDGSVDGGVGVGVGEHRTLREGRTGPHPRGAVQSVGGNKTRAATILGIDRKSLREKLNAAESARAHRDDGRSGTGD